MLAWEDKTEPYFLIRFQYYFSFFCFLFYCFRLMVVPLTQNFILVNSRVRTGDWHRCVGHTVGVRTSSWVEEGASKGQGCPNKGEGCPVSVEVVRKAV